MTPDPRIEVAAGALRASLWAYICGHEESDPYGACIPCAAPAVVAALDAHDTGLRERLAAALKTRAAELDALTITHQDRTAIAVCQIRRQEALHAARIAEDAITDALAGGAP